jgi:Tfp pilus assembly protein PilZ
MIWSATIFFLHINGVFIVTKRNFVVGDLPLCFLAINNLVALVHHATDEVCELFWYRKRPL